MIDAVRRDLEDLLNTRRSAGRVRAAFVEVSNSVVAYGLPDLASVSASTDGGARGNRPHHRGRHRPLRAAAARGPRAAWSSGETARSGRCASTSRPG